jgi:hypothetical protein
LAPWRVMAAIERRSQCLPEPLPVPLPPPPLPFPLFGLLPLPFIVGAVAAVTPAAAARAFVAVACVGRAGAERACDNIKTCLDQGWILQKYFGQTDCDLEKKFSKFLVKLLEPPRFQGLSAMNEQI